MKKKQKLHVIAFISMLLLLVVGMCLGAASYLEPKLSILVAVLALGLTMLWFFSVRVFTVMNEEKVK